MPSRSPSRSRSKSPSRAASKSDSPPRDAKPGEPQKELDKSKAVSKTRSRSRSRSSSKSSRSRSRSSSYSSRSSRSRSRSGSRSRSRSRSPRRRSRSRTPESTTLFVDKLSRNVNKDHLLEIFGTFGKLKNVDVLFDRRANIPKGSAYVEFLDRVTAEKAQLYMDGGQIDGNVIKAIPVKAGQLIAFPSIAISRLDKVWGDGSTFRPERWIAPNVLPPDNLLNKGWSGLFAFSQGSRSCIGQRMAILEYKSIVTMYIRNFVLHDAGAQLQHKFSATLQARVIGKEKDGPALPVRITLVEDER